MRASSTALGLLLVTAASARAQVPAGPEFLVNSYTTLRQSDPAVAVHSSGRFTISWSSDGHNGGGFDVWARRYAEDGAPATGEFQVNAETASTDAALPALTYGRAGNSNFAWSGSVAAPFDIHARLYAPSGVPRTGEFRVNSYTSDTQYRPSVAPLPGGGFVVAWSSDEPAPSRIMMRRYDAFGVPLGPDAQVSGGAHSNMPSVASGADGRFVVAWVGAYGGPCCTIGARLYDAAGNPRGLPFPLRPAPAPDHWPDVAMAADGRFVVVWEESDDGSSYGVRARLFSPDAVPLGPDFAVNAGTAGQQRIPFVAMDRAGDFVVVWSSRPGVDFDVVGRRFHATGVPRSGDFAVNTLVAGAQYADDVASDGAGNFVVAWSSGSGYAVDSFARRFGGLLPAGMAVDPAPSGQSDGNGVLEAGESVAVVPAWRNVNDAPQLFEGAWLGFDGPPGATYTTTDALAQYGLVASGATAPCVDCYRVSVSPAHPRPAPHWDAFAREDLAPDVQGQRKSWRLHVGDSFADVPRSSGFYRFVETLLHHAVTGGCAAGQYCPQGATTREQMAVFVLAARDAAGDPPPACGTPLFGDVPASSPYCRWIEELARSGVVGGCGGGNYCPSLPVSREQMAVFVLRTLEPALAPPACAAPMFSDVPASSPYCPWIEELARRGVVTGCGGGRYCPTLSVTRDQMAVFISGTFGLRLYGP